MMMILGSIFLVGLLILLILGDEPRTPEDEYEIHKYFQGSHKDV